MNICIYSPYIPKHTGGGEKYLFDVALVLAQRHQVSVAVPQHLSTPEERAVRQRYEQFLDQSLAQISFITSPLGTSSNALTKMWWTRRFDLLYYVTDGSLFWSLAGKNILHVQIPLLLNKSGLLERLKLSNWTVKNTNSEFTKSVIEPSWPVKIDVVHHPKVELQTPPSPIKKEKVILSVGRFFKQLHSKRQDVLVALFKQLQTTAPVESKGWKLVLIGTVEDPDYAQTVKTLAAGLPIEIYHDVTRAELESWYHCAEIYWHAAGFGVNEQEHPEKVEHFGISTAEAMVAGAVPVVIAKGGQKEILGSELKDWLWRSEVECVDKTLKVMGDSELRSRLQKKAQTQARAFDREHFEKKLWQMAGE